MTSQRPERIQRKRQRGWKKPDNTVCVTRGTFWGNPFVIRPDLPAGQKFGQYYAVHTVQDALDCYREYLDELPELKAKARRTLKGKNLACWCHPSEPCHADILLQIANDAEGSDK